MLIKKSNNKLVFIGDTNSINLEIIEKSHDELYLKNIKYILIGNLDETIKYFKRLKTNKRINEVFDLSQNNYKDKNSINLFNIGNKQFEKHLNIINQINISNNLAKLNNTDLVTMPINKSIIKKKYLFNGMTEHLGMINECKTYMLMKGEKFSIIPLTTHVKFKDILANIKIDKTYIFLKEIIKIIKNKKLKFNRIIILGINPHAGENGTLGNEELTINKSIKKIIKMTNIKIVGPIAADSAFKNTNINDLFISYYHDQALIPFKIINKRAINYTIGLAYNRYSPSHGTAENIIYKNIADMNSYKKCMLS